MMQVSPYDSFFNVDTNQTIEKVTYRMEVWRNDNLLARNLYYDLDGNLEIEVRPVYDCDNAKTIKMYHILRSRSSYCSRCSICPYW